MPENRKYFPHGAVVFIPTRVKEGLPLTPTHFHNLIILGILAKASQLYKVRLCHFVFMGNHLHLILVVESGADVSAFMGYLKGEISHSINRMLGRRQKTIWQDGYDSPLLFTTADVMRYIKYIYLNPTRSYLTSCIDEYPGVNSWNMLTSEVYEQQYKRFARTDMFRLHSPALSINEQRRMAAKLQQLEREANILQLEPYLCFEKVADYDGRSHAELRTAILAEVAAATAELQELHKKENKSYIGATALRRQSMLKEHVPDKFGKRMVCICSDIAFRKQFLCHYRELVKEARATYHAWKRGELNPRIPPGMFAPAMPCLASALDIF